MGSYERLCIAQRVAAKQTPRTLSCVIPEDTGARSCYKVILLEIGDQTVNIWIEAIVDRPPPAVAFVYSNPSHFHTNELGTSSAGNIRKNVWLATRMRREWAETLRTQYRAVSLGWMIAVHQRAARPAHY